MCAHTRVKSGARECTHVSVKSGALGSHVCTRHGKPGAPGILCAHVCKAWCFGIPCVHTRVRKAWCLGAGVCLCGGEWSRQGRSGRACRCVPETAATSLELRPVLHPGPAGAWPGPPPEPRPAAWGGLEGFGGSDAPSSSWGCHQGPLRGPPPALRRAQTPVASRPLTVTPHAQRWLWGGGWDVFKPGLESRPSSIHVTQVSVSISSFF